MCAQAWAIKARRYLRPVAFAYLSVTRGCLSLGVYAMIPEPSLIAFTRASTNAMVRKQTRGGFAGEKRV